MVEHCLHHPDVHAPWQKWSHEETLYVATMYSNPLRWQTRRLLLNDFRRHMQDSPNVRLYVGELAYGDRPFEVTCPECPEDVQLRTQDELWHKENVLNCVIRRFPAGWKYGAIIDGDFVMTRRDWALEAIHQLQHHAFVQLFSSYADLDSEHRPFRLMSSFAYNYVHNRESMKNWQTADLGTVLAASHTSGAVSAKTAAKRAWPQSPGATGGAWAFTREAFDTVGSLLDTSILGSGDWHMAFGLAGMINYAAEAVRCNQRYVASITRWQERALRLGGNIGYIRNHAIHHFHGSKVNRFYGDRWRVLLENDYDPSTDVCTDWQGVLRLTGNKPQLRDQIRAYFRARNEDDPALRGGEKPLV
jgi:hypothetical protein